MLYKVSCYHGMVIQNDSPIQIMLSSPLSVPGRTHLSLHAVGGFYCSDINELVP